MKDTQWMFQPQVSNRNNKVMLVCVHTAEGTYRNSSKSENDMNIIFLTFQSIGHILCTIPFVGSDSVVLHYNSFLAELIHS